MRKIMKLTVPSCFTCGNNSFTEPNSPLARKPAQKPRYFHAHASFVPTFVPGQLRIEVVNTSDHIVNCESVPPIRRQQKAADAISPKAFTVFCITSGDVGDMWASRTSSVWGIMRAIFPTSSWTLYISLAATSPRSSKNVIKSPTVSNRAATFAKSLKENTWIGNPPVRISGANLAAM
jgi:hypothetical protein